MPKYDYFVDSCHIDFCYDLKVSAIYGAFQEASLTSMSKWNDGNKIVGREDLDWIIINSATEIYKLPKFKQKMQVVTYPGDDMGFFYPRHCALQDEKGEVYARSIAIWGILETKFRHLCMERKILPKVDEKEIEHHEGELSTPRRPIPRETKYFDTRKIYYSDIDLNGHLNNVAYIEMMIDIHNKDFYKKYMISKINVYYKKELNDGDKVEIFVNEDETTYIEIKKDGEVCCSAEISYQKK